VNFTQAKKGSKSFTVWYAGPLAIENNRGLLQFVPSNLQRFTPADGRASDSVPMDPALPDYKRDVQYTVNGQFQRCSRSNRVRPRSGCWKTSPTSPMKRAAN